jgi:hypothetical protein
MRWFARDIRENRSIWNKRNRLKRPRYQAVKAIGNDLFERDWAG